jgi:flap endonuclease-1
MDPPKWKSADVEGMIEFMCGQNGFNEDRIRSGLKRLDKSKGTLTHYLSKNIIFSGKINQGRMDDFFKVAKVVSTSKPTPKKDTKRKAGKQKGTPAKKTKR